MFILDKTAKKYFYELNLIVMRIKKILLIFSLIAIVFVACQKDDDNIRTDLLGVNGLPKSVNAIVTQEIINTMKSLGITIYTGDNPPDISGTYLASPFILKGTIVPNDYEIGKVFADYYATFSDQNNDSLSIALSYSSSSESGIGIGSYISGTNNNFTVFAKTNSTYNESSAEIIQVISGTITNTGVNNFYYANFMLNNYGDSINWLGNGTGRVIYDSDGFSPKTTVIKSIELNLSKPTASIN